MVVDDRAPRRAEDVVAAFAAAIATGDADVVAALYEDDAVYYLPALGIAAKGRAAIRARWAATFDLWRALSFDVDHHELEVHGDLASSWLRARLRVRWEGTGEEEVLPVRAADVFHRGPDGVWRYAVDHA